jgi:hypothetical protein
MLRQTIIVSAAALVLSLAAVDAQQPKRADPRIPAPGAELLKPQPEPACEYKAADQGATRTMESPKGGDPAAEAALRTKLDYERQCYRHAEIIVRQRLHELQASLRVSMQAIERSVAQPKGAKAQQVRRSDAPDRDELGGERAQRREREAGSPGSLRP